jgi:hypothetical protein
MTQQPKRERALSATGSICWQYDGGFTLSVDSVIFFTKENKVSHGMIDRLCDTKMEADKSVNPQIWHNFPCEYLCNSLTRQLQIS